jgi:hypothetical protein
MAEPFDARAAINKWGMKCILEELISAIHNSLSNPLRFYDGSPETAKLKNYEIELATGLTEVLRKYEARDQPELISMLKSANRVRRPARKEK